MENAAADVSPWTLTVDIGGSKVNAALVDKDGRIGPRKTYGGPMADYAVALGAISGMVPSTLLSEASVRIMSQPGGIRRVRAVSVETRASARRQRRNVLACRRQARRLLSKGQ